MEGRYRGDIGEIERVSLEIEQAPPPYISLHPPTSPLHLPYISPPPPPHRAGGGGVRARARGRAQVRPAAVAQGGARAGGWAWAGG